ncbi:MAG: ABC transporter ATP-binding protein [Candidatus Bathyarchaeia archaeon]
MSSIVELVNVVKVYRLGEGVEVQALRGVSLKIDEGELVSIQGPSGSGKTTLLNMIGGLDKPTGGRVIIDGVDITNLGEKELASFRREKIGFIFQIYNLVPLLTALENVELPMMLSGKFSETEVRRRAEELLALVGLKDRMHHRPTQLSGGEQQRVAIARALANEPAIILADEPTGNLDQASGQRIIKLMRNLNETLNQTFIIVTHDPAVAEQTQRRFYMTDGKINDKPLRVISKFSDATFDDERQRLLLAELNWLKTSINYLEAKKDALSPEIYVKTFSSYKKRLERIKSILEKEGLLR